MCIRRPNGYFKSIMRVITTWVSSFSNLKVISQEKYMIFKYYVQHIIYSIQWKTETFALLNYLLSNQYVFYQFINHDSNYFNF